MSLQTAYLSNCAVLAELTDLLTSITDKTYLQTSLPSSQQTVSSIGAHCRHIIEFYQGVLKGALSGNIDYDQRARKTELEKNKQLALSEIQSIQLQLSELVSQSLKTEALYLKAQVDADSEVLTETNLVRELVFLKAHSVHHQAMIALLMHCFKQTVPKEFGLATSTRNHNQAIEASD